MVFKSDVEISRWDRGGSCDCDGATDERAVPEFQICW
jgi:hypothetical protein